MEPSDQPPEGTTKLPPLTYDDLSEEGWEKRRQELVTRGIDPDKYLRKELPRAFKRDPEARQAMQRYRAAEPQEQRLRSDFFKWGYRATLTGLVGV